jgi:CheY-like chemotaxis protein
MVLVVDDDPDIRAVIGDLLEDEGYEVASAANGREALGLLYDGMRPSVILLDLVMPVMSGWDFLEYQLRDPRLSDIPVVVFSAAGTDAELVRFRMSGVAVMPKPFDNDELIALVAMRAQSDRARPLKSTRLRGATRRPVR